MGHRIRQFDWSATPLANVGKWPQSLQSALSICLNSNFPIAIYWGPELTLLYNEAWSPIPGNKHPWSLGKPAKEVWPEIWDAIEPQFRKAFKGEPGGSKDALLPMQRHGYTEECYFDFTFTPVYGEAGKVEGVFNAVIETTYRLIGERRTAFLKNFALQIAGAKTKASLFEQAIALLNTAAADVPFAGIYSATSEGVKLTASTLPLEGKAQSQNKPWPFEDVLQSGKTVLVEDLESYLPDVPVVFWPEKPQEACILPLTESNGANAGFLVCGLSARRRFDEEYNSFLVAVSNAIGSAYNTIASLEEERKRTEALAEINRAKTIFFSNISHEFRTPLTLMLGPIEDALNDPNTIPDNQIRMEVAHRSGLRLQKLVNTLLAFSRIEAGRLDGRFEKVDICAFTKDLASTFRSAVEKAGMQLHIDCGEVKDEVYVDVDMWEKIVLNLVSNAFKYSNEGSINVEVKQVGNEVHLTVSDTGVGIPADQLNKIFDRFHRVENLGGRSQEGTGIGLSMVKELVKLHGGTIDVQSKVGKGSAFTIAIPTGKEHLAAEHIAGTKSRAVSTQTEAFVQEALQWMPKDNDANGELVTNGHAVGSSGDGDKKHKVLLADDNQDMRDYINRLLSTQFKVVTATDGEDAFAKANTLQPDLVLTDVMMPKLDGFGLLKRLRETATTKNIPVVFLSARAGEEAKVEGLEAGADDYLTKPFSAKEVVARVEAQIKLRETREKALNELYHLFNEVPFAVAVLMGETLVIDFINQYNLDIWQCKREDVIGKPLFEVFPGNRASAEPVHQQVFKTGKRFMANELPIELEVNGKQEKRWFNTVIDPLRNDQGRIIGQLATAIEVTEQVLTRKKIEESEEQLQTALQGGELGLFDFYPQTGKLIWSAKAKELFGLSADAAVNLDSYLKGLHPEDREAANAAAGKALQEGNGHYENEYRTVGIEDGKLRWVRSKGKISFDEEGKAVRFTGVTQDITKQKKVEQSLKESEQRFRDLANDTPAFMFMADADTNLEFVNKQWLEFVGLASEEGFGKVWETITHPDDVAPMYAAYNHAVTNLKPYRFEIRQKRADGVYRWVLWSGIPRTSIDGRFAGMMGVGIDVTEQKEVQDIVRASETKFRHLIQSNIVGVLFWDLGGGVVDANDEFLKMLGYTRADMEKGLDWRKLTPPHWEKADADGVQQVLETGQHRPYEKQYLHRNGHPVDVIIASSAFDGTANRQGVTFVLDITQRKKAEEQVRQSEQQFRDFSNNIQNLAWMADGNGWIFWYNQRWYDYTGTTLREMQGWGWDKVHHPNHIDRVVAFVKEAWKKPEPFEMTFPLRGADGLFRWFITRVEPILNERGEITRWIGTNTNIDEQVKAMQRVEASEARFRTLIEEAPVATCLFVGRELKIEIANEEIIAIMGKGPSVLGKPLAEAIPELVGQPFLLELDKVFATGETYENRNARADLVVDGEVKTFYVDYIFKPLKNSEGEVYAILDMTIDVTNHVLARKELEASESRFRILAETLPQMIWVTDEKGVTEYTSKKWQEYSGLENAAAAWEYMIHPDDKASSLKAYEHAYATGEPFRYEARLKNKNGDYRWHSNLAEPVKDASGNIVRWIGAITDIHEQKQFAEQLAKLVAERTKELNRSNEDLQQFAHVASHDLKEPLRKIRTFASRLKEEFEESMAEREKIYLAKMENAAERMYAMIDGVLLYSSANATEQAAEPVDLNETFRNIETDLEVLMTQKAAVLERGSLPSVEGSQVLFYQLFYNLVYNALKFSKADVPPVVSISSGPCTKEELKKTSFANRAGVKIILQDNGIGFGQSDAERIFQTFARLNSKDKYEGTGLGLALCKKIVERHGGAIWANGTPNEGAAFTLLLPLANSGR